jgi:preprotein translocase subunit YajC
VDFIVLIVLLFLLMWVFVLRPQRRRVNEQRSMVQSLAPGQEVLTAGGVYGDVTEVGEDEVALEIAPGVVVRVAIRAIAAVIPPDAYEEDEDGDGSDEPEALGPSSSEGIDDGEPPVEEQRRYPSAT